MAAFQQQTEVTPTHERAWDHLGVVLHNQGRYEEAIAAYQQQTEVTPTHEQAWDHLGFVFGNQGRYEEAMAAFQQQTEVTPTHERAWDHLGVVLLNQGRYEEAIAAFQQQTEVTPDHESAWKRLGVTLAKQGNFDEAIAAYQEQVKITPEDGGSWSDMGVAFWKQGKLEKAEEAWKQAENVYADGLKAQPDNLVFLKSDIELALVQGDLSRFQARITTVKSYISPDDGFFALLPFFVWLFQPDFGWESVLTAIEETDSGVSFDWNFFTTTPAIESQDEETQQIARHFIAFFEGKGDLPELKARLAELQD
ncbi:MAG: tetratricopeptide repeat protein, partial [Gammaproteobacteria bacterium]|nr:tetratricopeptide repeat protein [Gammaproteobacteria bacterium]